MTFVLTFVAVIAITILSAQSPSLLVLDGAVLIDGTGAPPVSGARVVIRGDRIVDVGPAASVPVPDGAERIDLAGRTLLPGLIDSHFHIESDPRLALRQLSHGVTSFRDPGQWEEKFDGLRQMIAADGLPGPHIFTAGPHIDGERPAYPADAVVARDPSEARAAAERNLAGGASALKIYFRLPLASAKAVIDVCRVRGVPCTAHLEVLDAADALAAGLHGFEHITSLGPALLPRVEQERYRQAVLLDNDARRDGRYDMFARLELDGPRAERLYAQIAARRPWLDATLAVFEVRAAPRRAKVTRERQASMVAAFETMKRLTRRAFEKGARVVVGGHSEVPYAGRGEAPWREIELLVESGFTPVEAIHAATGEAAAFLYRERELGTVRAGLRADLVVLRDDPVKSITAIRTVERVMSGGQWIDVEKYRRY